MAGNTFGNLFRLTTYGESHGSAIGGVLDGCPAGLEISDEDIQRELDRRRPGQSALTTPRDEKDRIELLSGIFEGKTTGTPIGFLIRNSDQRSGDYEKMKYVYRPGHADQVWDQKFGFRDHRGGGRSSARETASRVVGGAIAKRFLAEFDISIDAYVSSVKDVVLEIPYTELDLSLIDNNLVRCPDPKTAELMQNVIESARDQGDSVGGVITCVVKNVPSGLGEPVFDKLHAVLAHAMMSINATKGFEMDGGFDSTKLFGSENNLIKSGVSGGISNGRDIVFRTAFKPVSTISKPQQTINNQGQEVMLEAKGRHDPCVLPRAVPIVESMAALVIADFMLLARTNKLR